MGDKTVLVWFRLDLRLEDNPAVAAAVLADAGVRLGQIDPPLVVDHEEGRRRALAILRSLRTGTRS